MNDARTVSEKDSADIWSRWLDGDTVTEISRWGPVESRSLVKAVLEGDPAAHVPSDDPRRVYGGRFMWIALTEAPPGEDAAFVVVKSPRRYTVGAFHKAAGAIRRDIKEAGGQLNPYVIEGAGAPDSAGASRALIRMITNRGYRGYQFDEDGMVTRFEPAPEPEPEATAEPFRP